MFISFLKSLKKFFKTYKASLLSGVLFGCSFIPFPLFTLFFALVPLWFFIYQQKSLKKIITACVLCQFIGTFIGFNWMIYTFHNFGGMSWLASFILLLGFCLLANLYITLSGIFWFIIVKKCPWGFSVASKLILLPLIFALLHNLVPTLFPWNMGYPWLWGDLWGAQTAELWGFRFLGTLFYVFNLLFLIAYKHLHFRENNFKKLISYFSFKSYVLFFKKNAPLYFDKIGARAFAGAIALLLGLNILGLYLKQNLDSPDQFLNVLLVQNNIGTLSKLSPPSWGEKRRKALYISKVLTYKALKAVKKKGMGNVDLIVWSEGSYPYPIHKNKNKDRRISRFVKIINTPLVTGGQGIEKRGHSNSLFVFDRTGEILKPIYDKNKLVIFGEYFPGIEKFPILRKIFPYFGSNMIRGKEFLVQELEGRFFGWQICYEALFDNISRHLANKKAQFLVNITNDSWYGTWQEPYQHLIMSFARAVEVRRPLIRVANTGYSGVIRADGKIIDGISSMNKAWYHMYKIPYYKKNPPKTLFMRWGYYINEMFLVFLALMVFVLSFKNLKKL